MLLTFLLLDDIILRLTPRPHAHDKMAPRRWPAEDTIHARFMIFIDGCDKFSREDMISHQHWRDATKLLIYAPSLSRSTICARTPSRISGSRFTFRLPPTRGFSGRRFGRRAHAAASRALLSYRAKGKRQLSTSKRRECDCLVTRCDVIIAERMIMVENRSRFRHCFTASRRELHWFLSLRCCAADFGRLLRL